MRDQSAAHQRASKKRTRRSRPFLLAWLCTGGRKRRCQAIVEEREANGPFTSIGYMVRRLWSCRATRWNGLRLRARSTACATRGVRYCGACPPCIARRAAEQSPWRVKLPCHCRLLRMCRQTCRIFPTRSGSSGNGRRFSFHRKDIRCTFFEEQAARLGALYAPPFRRARRASPYR